MLFSAAAVVRLKSTFRHKIIISPKRSNEKSNFLNAILSRKAGKSFILYDTILTRDAFTAAHWLRNGEVVAFPTETVYGLGADVFNESAVQRIFVAKGRPADNPLIVHIAQREQLQTVVSGGAVTEAAHELMKAFWPGPLTLVLRKNDCVPLLATAGLATVGVRVPSHPVAHEFLQACGVPVAAPSANLSGRPSPTTWEAVHQDLNGRIACILQGAPTEVGLESTVVDCTGPELIPVVLRAGGVTLEQLREVWPATTVLQVDDTARAKSPGLRHRHYAPRARVILLKENLVNVVSNQVAHRVAYIGLTNPQDITNDVTIFRCVKICRDVTEYAHELFAFFRACDAVGVTTIYCQSVEPQGLGAALQDRLQRAAEG